MLYYERLLRNEKNDLFDFILNNHDVQGVMDQYKKNQKTMVLKVDSTKKKKLIEKNNKLKQKNSPMFYINKLSLPVSAAISIIIILIEIWKSGDLSSIGGMIIFFAIMCALIKFTTFLLNLRFSTTGISDLIGETIIVDGDRLVFSRHSIESRDGDSVLVSTINLKEIRRCEYVSQTEEITVYADYLTVNYVGDIPTTSGECTSLVIYDYFTPSLYEVLLSINIYVEVK